MREINKEEIKEIWDKNKYPVMLYIHSPFCRSICNYCCYKGTLKDNLFEEYFNKYLPSQIDENMEIIRSNNIPVIYFGGGTPNFNKDLYNLKPTFKKIRNIPYDEKVIELHYGIDISEDTLDILKQEGFTTIILCIQTFNKDWLKSQNRIYNEEFLTKNYFEKIMKIAKEKGFNIGIDLITDVKSTKNLKEDLNIIMSSSIPPEEITIAMLYQEKNSSLSEKVLNIINESNLIKAGFNPDVPLTLEYLNNLKVIRFFSQKGYSLKLSNKFYSFIPYLEESSMPWDSYCSCLGIGSYNNSCKDTYSHINHQYTYCTRYDGKETKYYLLREQSFYDKMRNLINWMEKVSFLPVPQGLHVNFFNYEDAHANGKNSEEHMCSFNIYEDQGVTPYIQNLIYQKNLIGEDGILNTK